MEHFITPYGSYVYILLDPRSGILTPFYVGKGKGRRFAAHFNPSSMRRSSNSFKNSVIQKIRDSGLKPLCFIIEDNLTDEHAMELERKLINRFGRRDLKEGILTNLTDGGDGPANPSPETREKIRQRMTGMGNPTYGVGHTEEARKKMSISQKRRVERGLVTRHSEEHKQKMRDYNAGGIAKRKQVLKLLSDGTIVETFESMTAAAKSTGWTKENFGWSKVKDGSLPLDGYFYRYEGSSDITPNGIKDASVLIHRRERHLKGNLAGKSVIRIREDGTTEEFDTIADAAASIPHIKYATLWAAIKFQRKCDGSFWKYLERDNLI